MPKLDTHLNKPDISFVMPCYKDAKTMEIAANSILDQDWKNLEVIVVNDNSPDNTNEVLDRLEKQDPRFKSVRLTENKGVCKARNEYLGVRSNCRRVD